MRSEIRIEGTLDEIAKMIAHKCGHCKFAHGRCQESGGCEKGIKEYLLESDEVTVKLPDLFED